MFKILKIFSCFLVVVILMSCLSGCKSSTLDKNDPTTLSLWHVYGEQADSPMNRLVEEFNQTVGIEKGIIINVTGMSNASAIGSRLLDAQAATPGSESLPDLFFGHKSNALEVGVENLIDWNEQFSKKELSAYIPEFLSDGEEDGNLYVFPVTKSTHLLFIQGGQFERFSKDTGVTYDSLSDWDGFFEAAKKYHEWSGGKPFCSLDYPMRTIELYAMSSGDDDYMTDDGFYNFNDEVFKDSFMKFAAAFAQKHIVISDLYSNTQVMTGEVLSGLGSSAAILYYNDTVTYADGSTEPMDIKVLPMPQIKGKNAYITQAGVGLCAFKSTPQKAEAAAIFAKWLTESERNLDFAAETGYMPVTKDAFDKIKDYEFKDEGYKNLYTALNASMETATPVSEVQTPAYYNRLNSFYTYLRLAQKELDSQLSAEEYGQVLWNKLQSE